MEEIKEVELLKKFKQDSGWGYLKISKLLGSSLQSVVNWIQGHTKPSPMARDKIRKFLSDYSYKD